MTDPVKDHVMGIPGTSSSTVEETIKGMWRTLSDDQKIHYTQLQSERTLYTWMKLICLPYISGEKNKDETELEKLKSNPYLILPPNYSPSGTFFYPKLSPWS